MNNFSDRYMKHRQKAGGRGWRLGVEGHGGVADGDDDNDDYVTLGPVGPRVWGKAVGCRDTK